MRDKKRRLSIKEKEIKIKIKHLSEPGYSDSSLPLHWHEDPPLLVSMFSVLCVNSCVVFFFRFFFSFCPCRCVSEQTNPEQYSPPRRTSRAGGSVHPAVTSRLKSKPSVHRQQLGKLFIGHHRLKCNIVLRVTCFYMSHTTKCLEFLRL